MKSITLQILATIGISAGQHLNYPYPPIPCGPKLAQCPDDMHCRPDSDCTDLARCRGTCVFTNTYASCGGLRIGPLDYDEPCVCVDDPRTPESCGMACDGPGICLPPKFETCGYGQECAGGTFCYAYEKEDCQRAENGKCLGVCL